VFQNLDLIYQFTD